MWSPEDLGRFVDHVEQDRFFALWMLVATTGLRRGELAGLTRKDVDLRYGRVSPSTPRVVVAGRAETSESKTRSGVRSLAMDPVTWSAMRGYVERWTEERRLLGQSERLLFVHADGRPLHPDTTTAKSQHHCTTAASRVSDCTMSVTPRPPRH